jgi:hypothetical protein
MATISPATSPISSGSYSVVEAEPTSLPSGFGRRLGILPCWPNFERHNNFKEAKVINWDKEHFVDSIPPSYQHFCDICNDFLLLGRHGRLDNSRRHRSVEMQSRSAN